LVQPRVFHPAKTLWVLGVLLAAFFYMSHRAASVIRHPAWSGQTMGTVYSIRLANANLTRAQLEELKQRVDRRLEEINAILSHYRPDSELSRFNAARAGEPVRISSEFVRVLRRALEIHERSDGAFDPALGALINAWGFGPEGREQPWLAPEDVRRMLDVSGAQRVRLTAGSTIEKTTDGVQLNLSAIAKGFGVDETARVIMDFGVSNLLVEIGGEVFAVGLNPYAKPWRVGVETPTLASLPGEAVEMILALTNGAVATSGDYRNYRTDETGRRFSHLLDPRTGYPVSNNVAAVSVIAPDCMTADALATAVFVLGPEKGLTFLRQYTNVEALLLVRMPDGRFEHRTTPGFEQYTSRSEL
jgi:thiamine biosynthesis lipoprotein